MAIIKTAKQLAEMSEAPQQEEAFEGWIGMGSALNFLRADLREDEFVAYASDYSSFMHAIAVPASLLNPPDIEDLVSWRTTLTSCWSITAQLSEPRDVWISHPLEDAQSKALQLGEKLVFLRHFEGFIGQKGYYEVLQKLTQLFELHFMDERRAYCRLDERGDIEEVIRIVRLPGKGEEFGSTVITFNRSILEEYLVLTDSVIVRTFDFTRFRPGIFNGWTGTAKEVESDGDLHFYLHIEPGHASYLRGIQIIRSFTTREEVILRHDPTTEKEREYASFIAHDWRHKKITEISTVPGETTNYFKSPICRSR